MPLDFVEFVDDLKSFSFRVTVHPGQLSRFRSTASLIWQKERFASSSKNTIPKKPGIYAFILESEAKDMPQHGYVMYVGITGDTSHRDLNARFGDYLREFSTNKRAHIYYMLRKWEKCLYFHYAVVTDNRVSLAKLEKALNDSFMPPYSFRDFTATVRRAKRAF